jgi:hypothetical protein
VPGKSWSEKLNQSGAPIVKPAPIDFAGMKAGEIMLVPTPRMIDAFIRDVPRGRQVSVVAMRRELAERHGAETTCPIYTGFHLRTVAEAACEALGAGETIETITPFWRLIDARAPTARRLASGSNFIRQRRREEGLE